MGNCSECGEFDCDIDHDEDDDWGDNLESDTGYDGEGLLHRDLWLRQLAGLDELEMAAR